MQYGGVGYSPYLPRFYMLNVVDPQNPGFESRVLRAASVDPYNRHRGIAYLSGMCSEKRKCILAEDNGLNLAFTIAHEMGHK
ncbi:UNVERIFIED_CONTAM: hypothetical protein FKN15_037349 [Acipenser sinensis]